MNILEAVNKEVGEMTPEQIKAEFEKVVQERAAHKAKQQAYNAKPEVKEKRKAYSIQYREKDPDGFKAKRKAYMTKPEVKARMKTYRQKRDARNKAILEAAKLLGITGTEPPAAPAA